MRLRTAASFARPVLGGEISGSKDRSRCEAACRLTAQGCLLQLSFGSLATAARSTGHWTVRWL